MFDLRDVLVSHRDYKVTRGSVIFKGENLLEMEVEDRSLAGIFLSFQPPVEIPGVSNNDFLQMANNARRRKLGQPKLDSLQFYGYIIPKLEMVNIKADFLNRNVNEGFSDVVALMNALEQEKLYVVLHVLSAKDPLPLSTRVQIALDSARGCSLEDIPSSNKPKIEYLYTSESKIQGKDKVSS
ncbi:ABC transporter I family member 6, chloroplastic [Tanacetum coccineum]